MSERFFHKDYAERRVQEKNWSRKESKLASIADWSRIGDGKACRLLARHSLELGIVEATPRTE